MANYDVFNGDADGICALTQLRLAEPRESVLVTGVKRDINLLSRVEAKPGDMLTVLDVSLDKNRDGLQRAIAAGASVLYVDHHFAGEIPEADNLVAHINTEATVCTSLLVNGMLKGQYVEWAATGAYGDNLFESADTVLKPLGLTEAQREALKNLGTYINYNGYGSTLDDLIFTPDALYQSVSPYTSPFDFMLDNRKDFQRLESGYHEDMEKAQALQPEIDEPSLALFIMPNEAWARRVSGVYSNDLANLNPNRAHAVLTEKGDGNYLVSVRAPLSNRTGADQLVRQFPTGGGRAAAAGINDLPASMLDTFVEKMREQYPG